MSQNLDKPMLLEDWLNESALPFPEQKFCLYIRKGAAISDIIECSSKDNIGLRSPDIAVMRSANRSILEEMYRKLTPCQKQLTQATINDMRTLLQNKKLKECRAMILEYTGKDMCCESAMESFIQSHSNF